MRPVVLCFLVATFAATPHAAAKSQSPRTGTSVPVPRVELNFSVDEKGAVLSPECHPKMQAPVCAVVKAAMAGWKIAPGEVAGGPAAMKAQIFMHITGTPIEGGYALHASYAKLSPGHSRFAERTPPPVYPRDEMMRGKTGLVELELLRDPADGKVSIGRAWLDGRPTPMRNAFVRASVAAVEQWNIEWKDQQMLTDCTEIVFTLEAPQKQRERACQPTYVEGFKPPKLLTPVEDMVF